MPRPGHRAGTACAARSVGATTWRLRMGRMLGVAGLMALAACGGGGSDGAGANPPSTVAPPPTATPLASASSNHFPLDANGVAVYTSTAGSEVVVVRVAGTQALPDQQTATLLRRHEPNIPAAFERGYVATEAGLRQHAAAGADAIERAFDGSYVMRWPAFAGDRHVQLDTSIDPGVDVDSDGRPDRLALRADVTVLGLEIVSTAAGSFNQALRVQQVLRRTLRPSSGLPEQQLVTTTDTWYAPGVGIVRQAQAVQGEGAGNTATPVTQSLLRYRFGTRSNDNEAPALLSVQPGAATPVRPGTEVQAVFTEEMDAASFTPQSFSVVGPDGRAVAGTLRVAGSTAHFAPAQALAAGSHRVVVGADVRDLLGHRLGDERSSFFMVDASAPQVVSHWPTDGTLNVALSATVTITLNEAPARASVDTRTVRLMLDGATVPASVSVDTGSSIALQPTAPLQRGRRYEVVVEGLQDPAGNPLAQGLRFGFHTTPGRYASPERVLPPANGSIGATTVAAGDVTGDGIPDVVYGDRGDDIFPDAVYLRAGRADGQLAPPVRLTLSPELLASPTQRCYMSGLAIGDLTGDGRADLAVTSPNCGALVLRQTGTGSLEPAQFLNELMQVLRVADVNGDGRLDLVGVQNYWNKVFVWLQQADGRLALDQTPGLGNVAGRDLALGDIDGDGRIDLVVALRAQDTATANIAILRQGPDGRFELDRHLSTGSIRGIWGLAVGDFNGDGRLDIAGTTFANAPASVFLYLQAADGSFPAATLLPTMDGAFGVLAGDVNGDGRLDLVVQHEGWFHVGLYLQTATGTMAAEELYASTGRSLEVQSVALADFNRDGLPDIVTAASVLWQVPLPSGATPSSAARAWRSFSLRSGTP